MAWLTGWGRRKSKNIAGSTAGAQANYQMLKIRVHKTTGTDTSSGANGTLQHVYVGANVRDDFGDVTFTKADGTTLLDFWMETYTSGTSADFYVEVDTIPTSPDTVDIYVYYDKSDETTASDGSATFIEYKTTGNVAFWHFDEGTGTAASDELGNNNLTVIATMWTTGKFDDGIQTSSGNVAKTLTPSASMKPTLGSWSFWTKRDGNPAAAEIFMSYADVADGTERSPLLILLTTGLIRFYIGLGGAWYSTDSTTNVCDNAWHHITVTYDSATGDMKIYVDGGATESTVNTGGGAADYTKADDFRLGARGSDTNNPFNGLIDEAEIFNIVLTQAENQNIYDNYADYLTSAWVVRKYASPEPSWGAFGSEETEVAVAYMRPMKYW